MLLHISSPSASQIAQVVTTALASRTDWEGHFAVIEDKRIRMRALHSRTTRG